MNLFLRIFPDDLHKSIKVKAAQLGISMQALIIQILTEWVERDRKEGEK